MTTGKTPSNKSVVHGEHSVDVASASKPETGSKVASTDVLMDFRRQSLGLDVVRSGPAETLRPSMIPSGIRRERPDGMIPALPSALLSKARRPAEHLGFVIASFEYLPVEKLITFYDLSDIISVLQAIGLELRSSESVSDPQICRALSVIDGMSALLQCVRENEFRDTIDKSIVLPKMMQTMAVAYCRGEFSRDGTPWKSGGTASIVVVEGLEEKLVIKNWRTVVPETIYDDPSDEGLVEAGRREEDDMDLYQCAKEAACTLLLEPEVPVARAFLVLGADAAGPSILMQQAQGESLAALMRGSGRVPILLKVILKQLLEALEVVHSNGVVHSDLQCMNVMVDIENQKIRLVDFGAAQRQGHMIDNLKALLVAIGMLPPEAQQAIINGMPFAFDDKVDIWQLGGLLIEMCVGRPFSTAFVEWAYEHAPQVSPNTPLIYTRKLLRKFIKHKKIPAPFSRMCLDMLNPLAASRLSAAQLLRKYSKNLA